MLPTDVLRRITDFLFVEECLVVETVLGYTLFEKEYYDKKRYGEPYLKSYEKFEIETHRIQDTIFSQVKTRRGEFVIRHNEELSTQKANDKAYNAMKLKYSKVLRRRLEMVS